MPSVPPRARQSPSQLAIRSLRRKFLMAELRTTMECEHASRQLWRCRLGTLKSKGEDHWRYCFRSDCREKLAGDVFEAMTVAQSERAQV